ncbi:uncharacterized protein LOC132565106 [Ylistrum balloti]|uniref:uncharacterized protein LOC132565106 n=1 Tax=Ylistrum balloti TaxID=509963 RepID=UPI002905F260|nr:uncharacterized protein LOC132565106 [Ylistrum balloti]
MKWPSTKSKPVNENKRDNIDPKIIDMSTKKLAKNELKLLKQGLKFCPSPRENKPELGQDIQEFERRLRLLEFFEGKPNEDQSLLRNKSNFFPPKSNDECLELFFKSINGCHTKITNRKRGNISKEETKALNDLTNDASIVIKEADKGGAKVIMDREFYKNKILELLEDVDNYKEIDTNKDETVLKRIGKLIKKYPGQLTDKEQDYLMNFQCKTSNFYGLPKIHKSKEVQTAIAQQRSEYIVMPPAKDLKMRPIVAGPASPTHRLSNFLDILLKPLCTLVPSYIKDDIDFLKYLPKHINEDTTFVSFDVISLYTNIPHELGIAAISYWLQETRIVRNISKEFVREAVEIVLQENTFQFNDKNYQQIQGTAMGTKMAPTYATLVMGILEVQFYNKYGEQFGQEEKKDLKENFKRFLDDCFILWKKSDDDLRNFFTMLNELHPKIQFTMEKSKIRLPFLDILLFKDNEELCTDIYYKSTDTHQYLNFLSSHLRHTRENIPFCLARRICTIIEKDALRRQRLEELRQFLAEQNHPQSLINNGIRRASEIPIAELRTPKEKNDEKVLPLVMTYNPSNPQIKGTVKQHMNILDGSERMKNIMKNTKFIASYCQPKNLKKYLTRASFS